MGNSRPGGRTRGAGGRSSTGREDAGASEGPPTPAPAARSGANEAVTDTPRLPSRGGPGEPGPRRSARNAPAPSQERGSTGPGNVMRPCSDRQQNGARLGTPSTINSSASDSLSAGSTKGAEEGMSQNASSSSKKRKRMNTRSYLKRFKPIQGANAADVVVASPDRVGKENTSSGNVADCKISKLCEGSGLIEKNKRHSSDAACKVSKSLVFGLHETSETRINQCSAPFSEVQPPKPTDVCRQNMAAESSLPVKARDRPTSPARQSCLSSLQSVPTSLIHHEEIKSTLGDSEPISVQKEDSASGHVKVMPSDETDGNSNICVACGTPGTLRSCDGKSCQSRYHISCLDSSLEYLSPGMWFCTSCTKKRFQFGLHSIVDGIESVWDVKEAEGMQNSKQYFVKYKNLAHVHNCWVPEGDINVMPGGPDLLSLFNKRNHTEKAIWKEEWTKPHRLLRKRLLMHPKLADDFISSSGVKYSYCNLEWLVKWRGLGYDHATWELETLPCLCTPEADVLKKNYENRREAAKQSSIPTKAKIKQSSFQKLQRLPDGCHPDFDNDHLCSINHLREFWYKSCGAVLVDEKEFVIKTVLFTMSVLPDVSQPILIVTTPSSLSLWEAQFNNLAPFINVLVYDGGKDKLKLIQDLEFYESGSCIMLQVLLSHADAILEDIEPISRIGWEAVIVDYYQKSTLQYLEQLKQLSTDFRMLLVSSPIKDHLPEYVKLLGFLSSGEQEDGHCVDTADALVMSEANFKRHIAYERRADSSTILEHWVPAYISQLQLEIYCSILLSNSSVLQSKMKSDSPLCDIIMSLSKCCDHPYLVDEFLPNSPVDNHDRVDTINTRVQACGKLPLLQKMLKEISNRRLRVIILFQSGVAGGNSMGDILEGVLCDRFGPESYARVESGAPLARKHAAVNMFNDKTKGRFVFLIESRACLPSIKLSSVDVIIIYNSDCNPLNDLKALQRIQIESQFKYPSIFRLYTPFTMEEKQLVLAKHGVLIDNYKDMSHSSAHSLISWGASFLFTRLDELQHDNYASKSFESDTYFMDKVILEFLKKLATNVEDSTKVSCASISKANMSGEFYSRSITLIGENVAMPALDGDPSVFWLNLLDGKSPCWSNISKPPQSSHRMLQNIEEPAKVPAEETDEARRKRRKVDITVPSSKHSSDNSPRESLALAEKSSNCECKEELTALFYTKSSTTFANDDSTGQESLTSECRNTEHIGIDNIAKPSMLLGGASSLVRGVNANNGDTVHTDGVHLESPNLASSQSLVALVGTQAVLSCMSPQQSTDLPAQQNVEPSRRPPAEAEQTGLSGTQAVQVRQPEMQPSILFSDAPPQKTHPDDRSQTGCQPDKAIGLLQGGASTSHHLGDVRMQVQENFDPNLGTDTVFPESPTYPANSPVTLQVSTEVEAQICESSIDAKQNTSPPAQQSLAISRHPPAEAEPSGILATEAAWDLQTEVQPSISMQDQPAEAEQAGTLDSVAAQDLQPEMQSSTSMQDVPFERTYLSRMPVLQSPTIHQIVVEHSLDPHAGVEPVGMVIPHDLQSEIQPSASVPAEQSKSLPAQQSLATSQHPPAEAKPAGILGTEPACDLQPEVQPSTSLQDEPAGSEDETEVEDEPMVPEVEDEPEAEDEPAEAERAGTLGAIAAEDLQPEVQSSTSTQLVSFGWVEPSLDRHAGVESAGTVAAHDLRSEILPSASVILQPEVQPSTSVQDEPAEAEDETEVEDEPMVPEVEDEPESEDEPAEAERAGTLGSIAAEDLQPEVQSSTSTQLVSFGRVEPSLDRHAGVESAGTVTAHDLQSEILPSASVPTEQSTSLHAQLSLVTSRHLPAEAGLADILGTESACDLQPSQGEMQLSTTMQDQPAEGQACILGAKPACILGPEPACNLQPELQPSTSVQDEPAEAEDETEAEDVPEVPGVEDEPAEAERAGTLGAIAAEDLQPEMQSSTSTQVVPFERTYRMSVVQSPTIRQRVEPLLDPHAGVESAGTVTAHGLQSEILPPASVPMEQSTSLPAEAGQADILGTEATCDLQPSQGEMQPSTTMQDQPAEGQACILGAIAARSLQPETQPSTSTQCERTHLVGMPMLHSLTLHHSVEPSLDPHARAESTHTLGSLIARDLQSEVHRSASMQDRPAEAEGAVMLGSTAAQDLQLELQSSTTVQHVPLERIHSEERRQIGFQPNMVPSPEQPTQRHPVTMLVFNNPMLSDEPLKNELDRLMHCNNVLSKDHEHQKSLLLLEYNQEIEKIEKKYDLLHQKEDSTYLQTQRELTGIYRKVIVNKSLAENFRGVFTSSSAAQGRSTSPVMEQPVESSSAAQTTASPVVSSSDIRPPAYNPPGSYVRPSFVVQPSSSWNAQPQTILPGNLYGTTSSPSVPAPVPYGSSGSAGAQSRAVQLQSALPRATSQLRGSAPHLQQLRMPSPYAVHTDQRQLPAASPWVTQFGQYAPVIIGSYASTVPSSVHHTMLPSASNSRPPRPVPWLPSGRHPELMVNLQPSSPNPAFFPALQSSYQNIAFGSTSGPRNAAPGSQQHAGAQIAGVNQPGSASLNAYMPARFGLGSGSSPTGAGAASAEVVCLSDDES